MILIVNDKGDRLCNDNRWRSMALFGNVTGCVKQYRRLHAARRRARHIGGIVIQLPDGAHLDASGYCYRREPCLDRPGYERCVKLNMLDYRVDNPDESFDEIGAYGASGL